MDIGADLLRPSEELPPDSPAGRALAAQLSALFAQMKEAFASGAVRQRFPGAEGLRPAINPRDPFLGSMCLGLTLGDAADACSLAFVAAHADDFLASLKSDGVRYLLVHTRGEGLYLVSRGNQIFALAADARPEIASVFDGELLSGAQRCFLLFDAVLVAREPFFARDYPERLRACERFEWQQRFAGSFAGASPLRLHTKDFFPLAQTRFLLERVAQHPRFAGHTDGLILARQHYPYLPGRSPGNLKWKPEELNTIDFLLAANRDYAPAPGPLVVELYVIQKEGPLLFDFAFFSRDEDRARLEGAERAGQPIIAEMCWDRAEDSTGMRAFMGAFCGYDSERIQALIGGSRLGAAGRENAQAVYTLFNNLDRRMAAAGAEARGDWRMIRLRPDKQIPNALSTAEKVLLSVHEQSISSQALLLATERAAAK